MRRHSQQDQQYHIFCILHHLMKNGDILTFAQFEEDMNQSWVQLVSHLLTMSLMVDL